MQEATSPPSSRLWSTDALTNQLMGSRLCVGSLQVRIREVINDMPASFYMPGLCKAEQSCFVVGMSVSSLWGCVSAAELSKVQKKRPLCRCID